MPTVALMLVLAACHGQTPDANPLDLDGDGFAPGGGDCDDGDASVNPHETEIWYDGIDQDCDGNDADQDGDGVDVVADCDDTSPEVHPGHLEVLGDNTDADCDGTDAAGFATWQLAATGLCGPSLDDDAEHVGIVVGAASADGSDIGQLSAMRWDESLGVHDRVDDTLDDDNDRHLSAYAVDHVEGTDGGPRDLGVGWQVDGEDSAVATYTMWDDGGWHYYFHRLESGDAVRSVSLRSGPAMRTIVGCTATELVVMWGEPEGFSAGEFEFGGASMPESVRCVANEQENEALVLRDDGTLVTYAASAGVATVVASESGWTAVDSHEGHVLLGRDGGLELRVDGVATDVPIDGVPTGVRLGGQPESGRWVAAWTVDGGGLRLTVVAGEERTTFDLDPGLDPIDDFDVAWSASGVLVVAMRWGDEIAFSASTLN
jgi:hypothetical protein